MPAGTERQCNIAMAGASVWKNFLSFSFHHGPKLHPYTSIHATRHETRRQSPSFRAHAEDNATRAPRSTTRCVSCHVVGSTHLAAARNPPVHRPHLVSPSSPLRRPGLRSCHSTRNERLFVQLGEPTLWTGMGGRAECAEVVFGSGPARRVHGVQLLGEP